MTHACDIADTGAGVLTLNPDTLRLVCKQRNAHTYVVVLP